jgi:RimJ/RimL family protein N-acetyltransferase
MYRLRELERKDLDVINKWRNDSELIAFLGAPFRYINLDVDMKWFETYMNNRNNAVRCAVTEDISDEILGLVSLVSINYINQSAEFHLMIGERKNQGKGMGTFAVQAMLNHAFNNMNLQRVELLVLADNRRAIHLYEKCGFKYEGRKRKSNYKNGKFVDTLMYSVLKSEYYSKELDNSLFTEKIL